MTAETKRQIVNPSSFPDIKYLIENGTIKKDFLLSIGISLDKEDFKDIKFEGIIKGIIDHNQTTKSYKIKGVLFLFPDSLRRYNRQIAGEDALTAYINAKKTGAEWKSDHLSLIEQLNTAKIKFEIREWDDNIFTVQAKEALHLFYSSSQTAIHNNPELESYLDQILFQATKIKEAQKNLKFAQFNFNKESKNPKPETDATLSLLQKNITQCEEELDNEIKNLRQQIKSMPNSNHNEDFLCDIIMTIISQAYKIDDSKDGINIKDTIKSLLILATTQNNNNLSSILKFLSDFQKDAGSIYDIEYYRYFQELKLENENEYDDTFVKLISAIKNATETRMTKEDNIKNLSVAPEGLTKHPLEELADLKKLSRHYSEDIFVHAYPHCTGGQASQNMRKAVDYIFSKDENKRNIYNCDIVDKNRSEKKKNRQKNNKNANLSNRIDNQIDAISSPLTDVGTITPKQRPHSDSEITKTDPAEKRKSLNLKKLSTSAESLPGLENLNLVKKESNPTENSNTANPPSKEISTTKQIVHQLNQTNSNVVSTQPINKADEQKTSNETSSNTQPSPPQSRHNAGSSNSNRKSLEDLTETPTPASSTPSAEGNVNLSQSHPIVMKALIAAAASNKLLLQSISENPKLLIDPETATLVELNSDTLVSYSKLGAKTKAQSTPFWDTAGPTDSGASPVHTSPGVSPSTSPSRSED